ncbi:hypothetical protein M5M_12905 [Simiduia agarivorans SA1 = DSM 21679]|uniref:DUF423 domain-containing protein n=1 Tax=Simiduia agarivorans (strain DSM 21679 / JCM 13881 / BCRC 17597 / SA1) TaxID=1117647 RepID=K4KNQ5_SIMAS|nr:hypothetical protein M5M_12905 [Simiduia agarivorans SA1 = DSM 21679]
MIAGAFGAHALKPVLSGTSMATWQTAVFYHLVHASLATAIVHTGRFRWSVYAVVCLLTGCLLFSGSLYALALGGPRWLGPITPLGGLCFIVGWLSLAIGAWRQPHEE